MISKRLKKTIVWRIIATGTTFLASYFITGELKGASMIALVDTVVKTGLYYAHEWVWDHECCTKKKETDDVLLNEV